MAITPLPPVPQRTDAPAVFVPKADTFLGALPLFQSEANAVQVDVNNNQVIASAAAVTATTQANNASASAALAQSSANATVWVSGTNYAFGATVISPANAQTYRRIVAGAGTTDPSLDTTNWQATNSALGKVTNVTSSITLTASLMGYIATAMTVLGQSVTLPSATTLNVGGPLALIDNTKGTYPVGIRDNTGVLLGAVSAGSEVFVSLKDRSTVAGIWSLNGAGIEPGLITIDTTFSSTYSGATIPQFVALDNNNSIHFALIGSGFAAFIVDDAGKAVTTPITVTATASSLPVVAFKIDATHAIVFFGASATDHKAVVLTLSGTVGSYSLAVGTPVALVSTMSASWGGENTLDIPRIVQLSSSLFFASFIVGGISCAAISVTGNVVTIGTIAAISVASISANSNITFAISPTSAMVVYLNSSTGFVNGVVVNVAGTTCTPGTIAPSGTPQNYTGTSAICQLSSTKFLQLVDNQTSGATAAVYAITISGSTVTFGSATVIETGMASYSPSYSANNANRYASHLSPLGPNSALLWYMPTSGGFSGVSRAVILTESAGVITKGITTQGSISNGTQSADQAGQLLPPGTSEFLAIKQEFLASSAIRTKVISHKISGTNILVGTSRAIDDFSPSSGSTVDRVVSVRMGNNDVVIIPGASLLLDSIPVIRSNGDYVLNRGSIRIPSLQQNSATALYFAQAPTTSNRIVIQGTTFYSGSTAVLGSVLLRLINLEIAA